MTDAYTLLMQLHGYVNKAVCIFLAVCQMSCAGRANTDAGVLQFLLVLPMKLDPSDDCCANIPGNHKSSCLTAQCLPTWDQYNAGWLTSWVLLISSSSLAI